MRRGGDGTPYQAARVPEQLVHDDIVRDDPAHPVEVRERGEDVVGEPIPAERTDEHVEEEAFAADACARADAGVLLLVEGVEERAGDQVRGPDWQWCSMSACASGRRDRAHSWRGAARGNGAGCLQWRSRSGITESDFSRQKECEFTNELCAHHDHPLV